MLQEIQIQNLLLIDEATLVFDKGFTVISGETGSGKTALVTALHILFGEKWDSGMVRGEKAEIRALFSFAPECVKEAGIPHEGELILERILLSNGRSKAYVNHKPVHISFLKQLKKHLIEIVDQQSTIKDHLEILDLYADATTAREKVSEIWLTLNTKKRELITLQEQLKQKEQEKARALQDLEELNSLNFTEGEDESLFEEYTQLTHVEERLELTKSLLQGAEEALKILSEQKRSLEKLASFDKTLEETSTSYKSSLIELQEISHTLTLHQSNLELNPHRLQEVTARLSHIDKMKKRYGDDILGTTESLQQKLNTLDAINISELEKEIEELEQQLDQESKELTALRKEAAPLLESACKEHLQGLNLPQVAFKVEITEAQRGPLGDETVSFWLAPNIGEKYLSVKDSLSGGERNRLLLALKSTLAHKDQKPTLFFDEIDANIGGKTATQVGHKLKSMSQTAQILTITHFPQVASQADHHYTIEKRSSPQKTFTEIQRIDLSARQRELERMAGK